MHGQQNIKIMLNLYLIRNFKLNRMLGGGAGEVRAGRSGDQNLVGARFSASVQTIPDTHTTFSQMGTGTFPWGKAPSSA